MEPRSKPTEPKSPVVRDFAQVFAEEIDDWIALRRALHPNDSQPGSPGTETRVSNELFGIALSGGGMRAATYALGVTQALADRGIMERADYLSMVSGGGYMGNGAVTYVAEDAVSAANAPNE